MAELEGNGGLAYSAGSYAFAIQMEDGTGVVQPGKWMSVFRQVKDGDWRMHRRIWTTDMP